MPISDVTLIPAAELSPGALGTIRLQVTKALLETASKELQLPQNDLVVRDIRPQADLDWGSHANFVTGLLTTELWTCTTDGANTGFQEIIVSGSDVMADQRFMALYGIANSRFTGNTIAAPCVSLFKIVVGNSVKAIWDTEPLNAYRRNAVGVSPSAIIIPQNTQFQLYGYITAVTTVCDIHMIGLVCEPRGKVLSP